MIRMIVVLDKIMIIWRIMRQQMKLKQKMIKTYMKKRKRGETQIRRLLHNNYPVTFLKTKRHLQK